MNLPEVTIEQLLEAGIHFGHNTRRWNPKMEQYIFGIRNKIHIIDLRITLPLINIALTKLYKVVENTERILAIEILNAAQALAFRNLKSSDFIEEILDIYRNEVNLLDNDRLLHTDIERSITFMQNIGVDEELL